MTDQLPEITEAQWAEIHSAKEEWFKVGTCTDPTDFPTTERVLTEFYGKQGFEAPKYYHFNGPYEACMLGPLLLKARESNPDVTVDEVRGMKWEDFYESKQDYRSAVMEVFGYREWGCEWCWWIAQHIVCRDVLGVTYTEEQKEMLDLWEQLFRSTGWFFPFDDVCLICHRHEEVKFDPEQRLHREDGPAVLCRDGYAVYAWHGTSVPKEWIEDKENVDPSLALTWENVEERRCLAEILGWARVLEQLDTRVIDKHPDPTIGVLIEAEIPDSGLERFSVVQCGTGRIFALPVGTEVATALEANALTYRVDPKVVENLEVRT